MTHIDITNISKKRTHGAVAAGHEQTAAAAHAMYEKGGNAVDAAVAAAFAAAVAEPLFTSIAGGGHFMVHDPLLDKTIAYDAFAAFPARTSPRAGEPFDFYGLDLSYGATSQLFHVGAASMAVPGQLRGLFEVHEKHGRLPFHDVVAPAIHIADDGAIYNDATVRAFEFLFPVIQESATMRDMLTPGGVIPKPGSTYRNHDLAATLRRIADDGAAFFYEGDIGDEIDALMQTRGGLVRKADLAAMHVVAREPLSIHAFGHELRLNPPLTSGGLLIALAMKIAERLTPKELDAATHEGSMGFVALLEAVLRARAEPIGNLAFHEAIYKDNAALALLDDDRIDQLAHLARIVARDWPQSITAPHEPRVAGNTTHISCIDADGYACAITTSLGESNGIMLDRRGVILNNFLGEDDINPRGFHAETGGTRMTSMMSPTLVFKDGKLRYALGSGGSKRIRTVIPQVLLRLFLFGDDVVSAVGHPRTHWEGGDLAFESFGRSDAVNSALQHAHSTVRRFDGYGMFFGGVHTVAFDADERVLTGAGDPRRGGVFLVS